MSVDAVKWVLENSGFKGTPRVVLIVIAECVNQKRGDWLAWPGQDEIAERANICGRQVTRVMKRLLASEELEIFKGHHPNNSSTYLMTRRSCKNGSGKFEDNSKETPMSRLETKQRRHSGYPKETSRASKGDTHVTRTGMNKKKEQEKKGGKSRPKDLDEVKEYAMSIGLPTAEAEKFYDHYEAVGWVRSKKETPIRDWKACVRTWKRNFLEWGGELIKPKSENDLTPLHWQKAFETLYPMRPTVTQWQVLSESDRKKIREHLKEISDEQ